ncbi:TetR/AcrR family transcriptional regulator [Candidatus Solincola tengchongensis]|uniref:TetR/AcrR family transcriptional regulator n=1 Tax=Candidatus Solincola tengchongensis TaxID=2900693 RepID=UPI00257D9756|nr:TetR/AcrR family transcriptional regulator [Candidatus Solincola tengchongensis]
MGNDFKSRDKFTTIIDAALKVFGEKGYYNATISEIARAAGVSEATIYEYFGSKEDLLFAIPGEITRQAVDFLEGMAPFIRGAANKIRAIVYGYYRLYKENPYYSSLVLLNLKHNRKFMDAEGYQAVKKAAAILLEAIKEGMESGEFRKDIDPYLVRSILLGTIEHIFFRWHLKERREELPDFVDPLMEILTRGIGKPPEPRTYQINISIPSEGASGTPPAG